MKRPLKLILFATGSIVAAMAAVTVNSSIASARATGTPCKASGLVTWLDTQGDGAAGSTYYNLQFTNLSGHACTLSGYPGVSAVGLSGKQLGRAARRNPQHAASTVTLGPGTSAKAVLQITQAGNFPASRCKPTTAAGLRVYPPNQTKATVIPYPFAACSAHGASYLSVEALQKT